MPFTVLCAADLNGKCNFEFAFAEKPTLAELRARVDTALAAEAATRIPHPFQISRVQVFDERLQMWVDLVAAVQLEDYSQLYAFQVETPFTRDLPGHIPPPQRPREDALYRSVSPGRLRSRPPPEPPLPPAPSFRAESPARSPLRVASVHSGGSAAPTHLDKVRAAYDEVDTSRARRVGREEWAAAFAKLRIGQPEGTLSRETVDDLFQKADRDQDGVVTFHEFQWFAEAYPKLLDSLYYRARSLVHETARKGNLERAREEQSILEQRLDDAHQATNRHESDALEQKIKADHAAQAVEEAHGAEQEGRQQRDAAHQESEEARRALREQVGQRDGAREQARQRDGAHRQALRGVDAAEKKQKQRKADAERAQRELERIQKLLEQKREEHQRLLAQQSEGEREVEEARQAAAEQEQARADAESAAQEAQGEVAERERELKGRLDAEGEAAQQHRALQREMAAAQQGAEREQQKLAALERETEAKRQAEERSERALEDCKKLVGELEERDRELDEKRRLEEEKENSIIESEIRLREQRAAVERQEYALSQAHSDFSQEMRRTASPPRV
eukprot:TRINITY_DN12935_c1_g1_i1.p1 TRINITY_DN12935_c1_g1~~TRINITY_DN12935_c1_g1_i1.p1  ORF type:complete len:595 (+),score=221.85 TRINITY_DN12935_c1_g1_i1:91-1785(+)